MDEKKKEDVTIDLASSFCVIKKMKKEKERTYP